MTVGPSNPHGTEVTNSASGEREQPPTKQTALRNTSKTTHILAASRVRVGCASCPLTSSSRRQMEIRPYYPPCGASTGVWRADGIYAVRQRLTSLQTGVVDLAENGVNVYLVNKHSLRLRVCVNRARRNTRKIVGDADDEAAI